MKQVIHLNVPTTIRIAIYRTKGNPMKSAIAMVGDAEVVEIAGVAPVGLEVGLMELEGGDGEGEGTVSQNERIKVQIT